MPAVLQGSHDLRGEVQPGGGRGHGPGVGGIHSLIALLVRGPRGPADIRGQGHLPTGQDSLYHISPGAPKFHLGYSRP